MMSDQPILHTLNSSGSGTGLSYYRKWLSCARRGWLEDMAVEAGEILPSTLPLMTGTIYHAFQELYRQPKQAGFDTARVEFVQNGGLPANIQEEARLEAERLFRAYRGLFKPSDLGRVVSVEEPLDGTGLDFVPAGMPITMRCDLVVNINVATSLRLREQRKINIPPGYYLVDYKTDKYPDAMTQDKYVTEIQFMEYQLIWNARHPKQRLSGALVDVAFKTTRPQFQLIYVPPVSETEKRIVAGQMQYAWEWYQFANRSTPPPTNPSACLNYKQFCPWMINERCRRY